MIGHMGSHEWRSDTHPADRINALEAEVERLKKTEQFLRSERPMARRLTELESALKQCEACIDIVWVSHHANRCDAALEVARAALKKEKP